MSTNSTFCDQCGKPTLRGASKFCSSCGAELPTLPLGDTPGVAAEDTQSSATEPPGGFQGGEEYRGRSGSRGAGRWIRRQQRQQRRDARSESVGDTPTTGNEDTQSSAPDLVEEYARVIRVPTDEMENALVEPAVSENPDNQGWQQYIPRPLWNSDLLRDYREHVQNTREEKRAYKSAHGGLANRGYLNNPISLIGGLVIVSGWLWAIYVCFSFTDNPIFWILSIFIAPVFMFYEGFVWGQWGPVGVMVPGFAISIAGNAIGPRPTLWRMFLAMLFILSIYFLPFGIGLLRNKRAKLALFFVNLIGGWTAIIWIIALIWALIPRTGDTTVPVINSRD